MACIVPGCKSHSSNKETESETLTFHRIPKNPELKNKWLEAISRPDLGGKVQDRKVCSKHFKPKYFVYTNTGPKYRRLRHDAEPTRFLPLGIMRTHGFNVVSPSTNSLQKLADETMMAHTASVVQPSKSSLQTHGSSILCETCEIEILRKKNQCLVKTLNRVMECSKRRLRLINKLKQQTRRLRKRTDELHALICSLVDSDTTLNKEHLCDLQSFNLDNIKRENDCI